MNEDILDTATSKRAYYLLGMLRIIVALLFMEHGLMKLFHFPGPQPGVKDPVSLTLTVAAWLEVVGGSAMLVGLYTRPVAFILSGEMAVGYFMSHASRGFWPALNQGDAAVLFCWIFLYISAAGPGAWSLDRLRWPPS